VLGFLNLNKPFGWTSHDCVAKVRRLLKQKRVGHGGTLDPAATGVLPIAVGKATRLLPYLPGNKAYRARIRLGMQTNTDDLEGEIIETKSASHLSLEIIKPLLTQFIGKVEQIPPAFSAIQKDGKRLYELARKGEAVEVPKRIVEIDRIEIVAWHEGEYPELEVEIACGAGTYIRAIARDLGEMLNVGGTLATLIRTESCGMTLSEGVTLEELEIQLKEESFSLIPPAIALQHLPEIILSATEAKRWCMGQKNVYLTCEYTNFKVLRVCNEDKQLLGIGEIKNDNENWAIAPKIVLV
jgi:tRNA pseudouridine55 synthase